MLISWQMLEMALMTSKGMILNESQIQMMPVGWIQMNMKLLSININNKMKESTVRIVNPMVERLSTLIVTIVMMPFWFYSKVLLIVVRSNRVGARRLRQCFQIEVGKTVHFGSFSTKSETELKSGTVYWVYKDAANTISRLIMEDASSIF